jgi:hypothetical protein
MNTSSNNDKNNDNSKFIVPALPDLSHLPADERPAALIKFCLENGLYSEPDDYPELY